MGDVKRTEVLIYKGITTVSVDKWQITVEKWAVLWRSIRVYTNRLKCAQEHIGAVVAG